MSETTTSHIMPTMRAMWNQGGIKTFYRGLVVSSKHDLGSTLHPDLLSRRLDLLASFHILVSLEMVHPPLHEANSSLLAIDMSTFERLKLAYISSTGKEDPGVLAMLAFGSISGSVGATVRLD